MAHKMHALLCLLGLALSVELPLISCQYTRTGSKCGEASCENATESAQAEKSAFLGYINVADSALKYFEIAKQIWNTNRQLKLYLLKNEQNDTLVEFRFADDKEPTYENVDQQNEVGRTFGIRRRMQLFLWLPISFKLGVIVTLLLVLTTMSLKTLLIGFIILLLLLTRTHGHAKLWGAQRAPELADLHRNVHIHVHSLPEDHQSYAAAAEPWHGSSSLALHHV